MGFFFIFIFFRSTHGGPPAPPEGLTLRTDVPSSPILLLKESCSLGPECFAEISVFS